MKRWWYCPDCGHTEPEDPTYTNHYCPVCGSDEWHIRHNSANYTCQGAGIKCTCGE